MDQEKNKRTREYDDVEGKIWNKKSKKRDKNNEVEEKGYLAFGVFDFPWLKEGVICKSEECLMDFEDNFLSLLQNQDNGCFKVSSGFEFFDECEDPKTTMDDVWLPFEINGLEPQAEDLDCIWSSLLND
ncbi:unnamed protein product [Lathyrus oleraceus]|uniref:uncharacterized protein LOC127111978 n=1 Tax=Pisum sativum TaxID=3888 RepID=UPI001FC3DD1E|nr:uncharacterized protein LOC127111978 [Pisum sativum]